MADERKGIITTFNSFYCFDFEPRSSSINFHEVGFHKGYNFTEIVSCKEAKCYFLHNKADNLLYRIKFNNLRKLENLHFMVDENPIKDGKIMSINSDGSLLGFLGMKNKLIILEGLGDEVKEFSVAFIQNGEEISDFCFLKGKLMIVLTTCGKVYKFLVEKRVSEIKMVTRLNSKIYQEGNDDYFSGFKICKSSQKMIVKISNKYQRNYSKVECYEFDSLKYCYELKIRDDVKVKEMVLDYYIGDYPVAFVFPESEPKSMMIFILYEDKAKKICSIQTLHLGNLVDVFVNKFQIVSLCDDGVINSLRIL